MRIEIGFSSSFKRALKNKFRGQSPESVVDEIAYYKDRLLVEMTLSIG